MDEEIRKLCEIVRRTALSIHKYHRHGHLEKVYEAALHSRLTKNGLTVERQKPLTVRDEDGTILGEYFADLFLQERLIIEVKACRSLVNEHTAQLLGYLRSAQIEHGLLINFGAPKIEIKKFIFSAHDPL